MQRRSEGCFARSSWAGVRGQDPSDLCSLRPHLRCRSERPALVEPMLVSAVPADPRVDVQFALQLALADDRKARLLRVSLLPMAAMCRRLCMTDGTAPKVDAGCRGQLSSAVPARAVAAVGSTGACAAGGGGVGSTVAPSSRLPSKSSSGIAAKAAYTASSSASLKASSSPPASPPPRPVDAASCETDADEAASACETPFAAPKATSHGDGG